MMAGLLKQATLQRLGITLEYSRIDPFGRFMVVGNQFADNVTTFRVNHWNGSLRFTGNYTPLGSPSGMVFLF